MDDLHDVGMGGDSPEARFGAGLRRIRVQAGLSVRLLARELDRAHSTISDFENGRLLPGVEVVEQYEDYFGWRAGRWARSVSARGPSDWSLRVDDVTEVLLDGPIT